MTVTGDGNPVIVLAPVWSGNYRRGQQVMARLQELGRPIRSEIGPTTCSEMLNRQESTLPKGRHYAVSTRWLRELTPGAISVLLAAFQQDGVSPYSIIVLHHFHGAGARVSPDATAFGMRDEHFTMLAFAAWEHNQAGVLNRKWARDLSFKLRPFSFPGGYANLLGPDGSDQVADAYGPNAARLRASKAEFDPDNVFSSALMLP
jgi:hypothetical protein